jgi:hypothetical protein
MFDVLSTLFSEMQRVSYMGIVGEPDYDRRTFEVLFGAGGTQPVPRRWLTPRTAALAGAMALPALIALGVLLL